jgi:hypothetical protein
MSFKEESRLRIGFEDLEEGSRRQAAPQLWRWRFGTTAVFISIVFVIGAGPFSVRGHQG